MLLSRLQYRYDVSKTQKNQRLLHGLENHVPRMGSGGPAWTADQADTERHVFALIPRVVRRTRVELSIARNLKTDG